MIEREVSTEGENVPGVERKIPKQRFAAKILHKQRGVSKQTMRMRAQHKRGKQVRPAGMTLTWLS